MGSQEAEQLGTVSYEQTVPLSLCLQQDTKLSLNKACVARKFSLGWTWETPGGPELR